MKLRLKMPSERSRSGISLIECLVYVAVLTILTGVALGTFYVCWDGFRGTILTSDDVSAALRAGERWRADVRGASGTISVEKTASGQILKIPESGKQVVYSFDSGALRRGAGAHGPFQLVFAKVKSSEMKSDIRDGVRAWQWELELPERSKGPHVPMLFTFEAAQRAQ